MTITKREFTGQRVPAAQRLWELRHTNKHRNASHLALAAAFRRKGDRFGQHLALAQYLNLAN